MKRIILALMLVFFIATVAWVDSSLTLFDDFAVMVRHKTHLENKSTLPDSVLWDLCSEAIIWTSVDIGGCEHTYKINTVANQNFYQIPDSITSINRVTMLTGDGETKSLKQWYPEYFDYFSLPTLSSSEADQSPIAYDYWADTLQMMPTPVRVDTVYIKAFTEHIPTDTAAATDDISLRPGYAMAALDYACYEALKTVGQFESANQWFGAYEKKKADLTARYMRRMDVNPVGR